MRRPFPAYGWMIRWTCRVARSHTLQVQRRSMIPHPEVTFWYAGLIRFRDGGGCGVLGVDINWRINVWGFLVWGDKWGWSLIRDLQRQWRTCRSHEQRLWAPCANHDTAV
jgi:hypothetical protein